MADGQETVASSGQASPSLDAMAAAIRCALTAQQVVIATRVDGSWVVRGAAGDFPDERRRPTRLLGLLDAPAGTLLGVTVLPAGTEWRLTNTETSGTPRVAMVADNADQLVLLLVAAPASDALGVRLDELLGAAVEAVRAEDRVHRRLLQESLQEREDERRRWARELHDETLQQLGALHVLLTAVRRQHGPAVPGPTANAQSANAQSANAQTGNARTDLAAALDQAIELASSQITSLRHLINELRPAALDELGLRPPLEALADRTQQLTGMRVDMRVSLPYADGVVTTRLLPDVELAVYRVVQEALTNAARHSRGTEARVTVVEDGDQVRVEVSDNGAGASRLTGFGIEGMRERAALAGGRLDVFPGHPGGVSENGSGTTVRMVVPALHRRRSESSEG